MNLKLDDIVRVTSGTVLCSKAEQFDSYDIDSRRMRKGGLFFALKGEQTDGHLFVQDAADHGAAGAIVECHINLNAPATIVQVGDSLTALRDLAASVRMDSGAQFVGITGSSGKTSTKEFTAALLSRKYGVYKSEGNLNSTTGLPLSLLSMQEQDCAVFEIGMNHEREIALLTSLLMPQIGVVLNVNPVHLGFFDSIEEIADEKCSLVHTMPPKSIAVYNCDDLLIAARMQNAKHQTVSFGFSSAADLRIADVQLNGVNGSKANLIWKGEQIPIETVLCGCGHLQNIAAAACVAFLLNVDSESIRFGIADLLPYSHRGTLIHADGIDIYDDSYNSNPRALALAIEIITQSKGYKRKIAVLGDMLELGPQERKFHADAGKLVAEKQIDLLITAGPLSSDMAGAARNAGMQQVYHVPDSGKAAELAPQLIHSGDLVLIKGSRGMKMETVIEALKRGKT